MSLSLAPARRRDAPQLARILAGWMRETPWMPKRDTPEEDRRFLDHLIRETEVVTARGFWGPLGFLARDGETVHALYLAPAARGQGLGKRLIDDAKAKTARLVLWTFQANAGARRFYAREGFAEVELTNGEGNDEGLPDVRLVWQREDVR